MVNTPIPHSLKSEAKKAAKILREFTIPTAKTGPDKLIPAGIFAKARGLAIITVFKAGFLVTARGGSGIVIAKIRDSLDFASGWSAPSAIGMAGLGGGFEIGAEVTDFVIILNSKSAVEAFSKGGNLTLGGNFTIAAGPLGRNIEGDVAVRSPAAIYTYSKTKGIFAGISVEGSALIERKDANRKFYGKSIRAHQILQGEVDIPEECEALYRVMREHQEMAARAALKMAKNKMKEGMAKSQSDWSLPTLNPFSSSSKSKSSSSSSSSPSHSSHHHEGRSYSPAKSSPTKQPTKPPSSAKRSSFSSLSSFSRQRRSSDSSSSYSPEKPSTSHISRPKRDSYGSSVKSKYQSDSRQKLCATSASSSSSAMHDPWAEIDKGRDPRELHELWVVADFPFQGQLTCDLSFQTGDKILVMWHSNSQNDWWEGVTKAGRQGIFPANYCHVV